jgi:hypothetical protein
MQSAFCGDLVQQRHRAGWQGPRTDSEPPGSADSRFKGCHDKVR